MRSPRRSSPAGRGRLARARLTGRTPYECSRMTPEACRRSGSVDGVGDKRETERVPSVADVRGAWIRRSRGTAVAVTVEPITHEVRVATDAAAAFSVYTGQIGEWWDRRLTANPHTLQTVTIETRVGGRVSATHSDFGDHEWGVVTVCEPGHRLAHSFTLAQDPNHPRRRSRLSSSQTQLPAASCGSRTAAGPTATPSTVRSSRSGRRCSTGSRL